MISTPHRQTAIALINDAVTAGARRVTACAELEVSTRTLRRWTKDGQIHADQRPLVPRPEPASKLSAAERAAVLEVCNSTEFVSLPPGQIVPQLADQGRYLASESSFYRILRADGRTASPWPGQAAGAAQTTHQLQGQRALRGLDMGVRRGPALPGSNCPGDSLKR